jgi:hypothetical protein
MADGAPPEAVNEAVRQYETAAMLENRGMSGGDVSIRLAVAASVLGGDYEAAEKRLRSSARATNSDFSERAHLTTDLALLLDETGRARDADALVSQTVLAGRALARPADPSTLAHFYARAMIAGALSPTEVEAQLGPTSVFKNADQAFSQWYRRQLLLVRTPGEAHVALDAMPERPDSGDWVDGEIDYQIARVRALAGDLVGARHDAESAVKRCDAGELDVLDDVWPLLRPRAFFLLGEMSERTGEIEAARAAYETVVKRWGGLKPRAVLAERAHARLAALTTH